MAVILLVAAPMSILRSFFLAGYTASVPALVGRSQVGRANSFFEAIYSVGLHHRPGHRRRPGRDDRPRADAGHRRGVVRAVGARAAVRPARPARADRSPAAAGSLTEIREGIDFIARRPDAAQRSSCSGARPRSCSRRSSPPSPSTSRATSGSSRPSWAWSWPPTASGPSIGSLLTRSAGSDAAASPRSSSAATS